MGIEIINPRHVTLSLPCRKKRGTWQVNKGLHVFLKGRGWIVRQIGKSYATVMPPGGVLPPFVFNVDIPTKDQVVAVAQEKHAIREPWVGMFGEWAAGYVPPRGWSTGQTDPFTAKTISEPVLRGVIPAFFYVGFRGFWHAEVEFRDGTVEYFESNSQPIQSQATGFISPDEIPSTFPLIEGAFCRITVNAYERNPEARRKCIEAHGTRCCICGFSFGATYGSEAEGYIHVHHVRPLSEVGAEYVVDPVRDLQPVCPNCHAMLHLGEKCRTIEDVRQLLERQRGGK